MGARSVGKCLNILFVPNNGFENMASLRVLSDELQYRGHQTVFAVNIAETALITSINSETTSGHCWPLNTGLNLDVFCGSPLEVLKRFSLKCLSQRLAEIKEREHYFELLLARLKPDVIIVESVLCSPAITNSGIPWVWLNFGLPNQCVDHQLLPPAGSGLSQNSDKNNWIEFRDQKSQLILGLRQELDDWCQMRGTPALPPNQLHPHSPYLNIYIYPKELDFTLKGDQHILADKWHRFNCLTKGSDQMIMIPPKLTSKSGHIIYLSLGSYGSADEQLVKRLIPILSHNREDIFLVENGPFNSEYKLCDHFWCLDASVPQSAAIHASDLVITCGDTRTVTEAVYYGKPMIVMPLYGQQLDNAQRVKDTGFGIILEPYKCHISTTFGSITALLNDSRLKKRLDYISYKMQTTYHLKPICRLIESVCE